MPDIFSQKHATDRARASREHKDAADKATLRQKLLGMDARKKSAERPPNDDIGHPWPRKFYEPGF